MRDLAPGFNGFDKDNCKAKDKHLKFVDMVRILSDVWQYVCWIANSFIMGTVKAGKLHTVFHKKHRYMFAKKRAPPKCTQRNSGVSLDPNKLLCEQCSSQWHSWYGMHSVVCIADTFWRAATGCPLFPLKNAKMWNFDVFVFVCLISQVKL